MMYKRSLRIGLPVAAVVILAALPVVAQAKKGASHNATTERLTRFTDQQAEVKTTFSLDEMAEGFKGAELDPQRMKTEDGKDALLINMGGIKVVLLPYGKDGEFDSLNMSATWATEKDATAELANEWNLANRYATACAKGKDYILRCDLDFAGGVTEKTALACFLRFKGQVTEFAEYLKNKA